MDNTIHPLRAAGRIVARYITDRTARARFADHFRYEARYGKFSPDQVAAVLCPLGASADDAALVADAFVGMRRTNNITRDLVHFHAGAFEARRIPGRPPALSLVEAMEAREEIEAGQSLRGTAARLGVSPNAVRHALALKLTERKPS
jgi:hypothetical protein